MMPTLLALFAHPDDEATWAGATLARYSRAGVRVGLVTATAGEAGELPCGVSREDLARVRARELRRAARALSVHSVRILGYPDGALAALDPGPVVARLRSLIRRRRPDAVLTFGPEGGDGHPDHVAVGRLTAAALRAAALDAATLYGAVPAATGDPSEVTLVADPLLVSAKLRAAACHRSQPSCAVETADRGARLEVFRRLFGSARAASPLDPFGLLAPPASA